MAIVAIDAIVDPPYPYRCLKKRLDLRMESPDANSMIVDEYSLLTVSLIGVALQLH